MIPPKGEDTVKDTDGMQRELECSTWTVEYDWLQEDNDGIGNHVSHASDAHEQRSFLPSVHIRGGRSVHVTPDVFVMFEMSPKLDHVPPICGLEVFSLC